MIGLIAWGRFFQYDANGHLILNPDGSASKITVPAPPEALWLWDFLHSQSANLGQIFDAVLLPPCSLAQGGIGAGCDGYEVFQRRNLDGTRYGNTESLLAAIAALKANGVVTFADLVLHQMGGDNGGAGFFKYKGAADAHNVWSGRGQMTPGWFRGNTNLNTLPATGFENPIPPFSPADQVPVPADDFPFGRELVYQNCNPAGLSEADAKEYLMWLCALLGVKDFRFDDTKGTYTPAVASIMNSLPFASFFSEYFDGNPNNLNWWATSAPMNSRSAVEDFTLHWRLQAACNNFNASYFDQGGAGYWQWNAGLSVGFVDNPDTDTSDGQQIVFNKGIAYALMLNLPLRQAFVYGKDYYPSSVWPGAYGLKPIIDNLCWISRMFAIGAFERRWVDNDVYAYTRDGNGGPMGWSGGLLVAVNFNTLSPRTITVQTMWGEGTHVHDYTGHANDAWVGANGMLTITIPSNAYSHGKSFVCYAPAGVNHAVPEKRSAITQNFEAATDLINTAPASNGTVVIPQRIYAAAGTKITLEWGAGILPPAGTLAVEAVDVNNKVISMTSMGASAQQIVGKVLTEGWHTLKVTGVNIDAGTGYTLSVTYTGASA